MSKLLHLFINFNGMFSADLTTTHTFTLGKSLLKYHISINTILSWPFHQSRTTFLYIPYSAPFIQSPASSPQHSPYIWHYCLFTYCLSLQAEQSFVLFTAVCTALRLEAVCHKVTNMTIAWLQRWAAASTFSSLLAESQVCTWVWNQLCYFCLLKFHVSFFCSSLLIPLTNNHSSCSSEWHCYQKYTSFFW